MYNGVFVFSLGAALLCVLLCVQQIFRRLRLKTQSDAAAAPIVEANEFTRYLLRLFLAALLLFVFALGAGYYLDNVRHGFTESRILIIEIAVFFVFLGGAVLTEQLRVVMQRRAHALGRESTSRIFRYLLYAGALLGMCAVALAALYVYEAHKTRYIFFEIFLLPAYAGALILFWLRFKISLIARSSDYAYELMSKQEALLPLMGSANPLWRLRRQFATINRFFFYPLEFFVLCMVVLLISDQIEAQTKIASAGRNFMSLTVFAIGIVSAIPAFFIMRVRDKTSPETFLWNIRIGYIVAISVQAMLTYFVLVVVAQQHIKYFWIVLMGSMTALLLNFYSTIFVAENHRTARSLIAAAASSVSTVVHKGIAAGMRGAAIPALIVVAMMGVAYILGIVEEKGEERFHYGLFALALALTSMISLFTVAQATAAIMPLAAAEISRLKLAVQKNEKNTLMQKFRNLRSVSVPSYVLHGKMMLAALAVLMFLVYSQIVQEAGGASVFKHLTETAMLLVGGIASYYLAARIGELVLNLGPLIMRETGRQFREISGLTSGQAEPDVKSLHRLAERYLKRKLLPLFAATMLLPAAACLFGGAYGLAGYLMGFGLFSFLNGNSWLTTGAAWSSARHAAEGDAQVVRHTAQYEALVQADIVGDSMHEAGAPTLAGALLSTIIAAVLFTPATLELHEVFREYIKTFF